jgi:hypothetical protein
MHVFMTSVYSKLCGVAVGIAVLMSASPAVQAETSFQGKNVTMIIGSAPGGGTDASGRAIARFLGKYLPGAPAVVVQNMPGASGITAMNHFVHRTQPDGLTVVMGSNSIIDPVIYRNSKAQYDTRDLRMVGGVGRGGTVLFIKKDAEKRLYDRKAEPVVIGTIGPVPRAGMQPAVWSIEYLGWNAKWVAGYPGSNEVMLALDRGELELSATSNIFLVEERIKAGAVKILFQGGQLEGGKVVGRPEFGDAPIFLAQMQGKITDPVAQKAFEYWVALSSIDKWLALAPGTPDQILATYRDTFKKAVCRSRVHQGRRHHQRWLLAGRCARCRSFRAHLRRDAAGSAQLSVRSDAQAGFARAVTFRRSRGR